MWWYAAIVASIAVPPLVLVALDVLDASVTTPLTSYLALVVDGAAATTGVYLLTIALDVERIQSAGKWFPLYYILGAVLLVSGLRFGYRAWSR